MESKNLLRIVLTAVLLIALLSLIDSGKIYGNISHASPWFYGAATLVFLTTYISSSMRWKTLSDSIGYDLSLLESFRLISVSYSFNKLFPGNTGDMARSKIFERYREIRNHGEILGIVALERYLGMLSLLSIVTAAFVFIDFSFPAVRLLLVFGSLAAAFSLLLVLDRGILEQIKELLPFPIPGFLDEVIDGYKSCSRRQLAFNLGYSLYIRIAEVIVFYLLAVSLSIGLGFWEAALITSFMSLVSSLPITPAGLGAVEVTGTGLLVAAGLSSSVALSLVILQRSLGVVLVALIGFTVYNLENFQLEVFRDLSVL